MPAAAGWNELIHPPETEPMLPSKLRYKVVRIFGRPVRHAKWIESPCIQATLDRVLELIVDSNLPGIRIRKTVGGRILYFSRNLVGRTSIYIGHPDTIFEIANQKN